jgi:hypothetical protein
MKRITRLVTVVATMVVMVALSGGPAFADDGSVIRQAYGKKVACVHKPETVCTEEFIPNPSEGHRRGTEGGG